MSARNLTAAGANKRGFNGPTRPSICAWYRGSKQWIQRIVVKGRRRDLGLGAFPVVGLTDRAPCVAVEGTVQRRPSGKVVQSLCGDRAAVVRRDLDPTRPRCPALDGWMVRRETGSQLG